MAVSALGAVLATSAPVKVEVLKVAPGGTAIQPVVGGTMYTTVMPVLKTSPAPAAPAASPPKTDPIAKFGATVKEFILRYTGVPASDVQVTFWSQEAEKSSIAQVEQRIKTSPEAMAYAAKTTPQTVTTSAPKPPQTLATPAAPTPAAPPPAGTFRNSAGGLVSFKDEQSLRDSLVVEMKRRGLGSPTKHQSDVWVDYASRGADFEWFFNAPIAQEPVSAPPSKIDEPPPVATPKIDKLEGSGVEMENSVFDFGGIPSWIWLALLFLIYFLFKDWKFFSKAAAK